MRLLGGDSLWPSIMLRALTLALSCGFIYVVWQNLDNNLIDISKKLEMVSPRTMMVGEPDWYVVYRLPFKIIVNVAHRTRIFLSDPIANFTNILQPVSIRKMWRHNLVNASDLWGRVLDQYEFHTDSDDDTRPRPLFEIKEAWSKYVLSGHPVMPRNYLGPIGALVRLRADFLFWHAGNSRARRIGKGPIYNYYEAGRVGYVFSYFHCPRRYTSLSSFRQNISKI